MFFRLLLSEDVGEGLLGCHMHAFSESVRTLMVGGKILGRPTGVMGGTEALRKECWGTLIQKEPSSTSDWLCVLERAL